MSQSAQAVVDNFQQMVGTDGGKITLLGVKDGVMSVRYAPGTNEACADCVLAPEDLKELMKEAVQMHDASIKDVTLEVAA
jgi:Fe-S cluster biogenesis protein NfuA